MILLGIAKAISGAAERLNRLGDPGVLFQWRVLFLAAIPSEFGGETSLFVASSGRSHKKPLSRESRQQQRRW
jgi:hypothetical protein